VLGWLVLLGLVTCQAAAFDLAAAKRIQLDNGLTLIVLEVPQVPVVSVQLLYRVGARNEEVGRTGLAHFLEHMAFRASEHFPDTDLVSSIYAVGGEWHGYTWLDQTTYYETLPAQYLDLALRIEADRMARLLIPAAEVEAERGAVLAELHGYENDPATVLKETVCAVSFLQHPYRNNSIGWESDVESISHDDVVDFYRRHYRPANAVLAVVGGVSGDRVIGRVRELFGALPGGPRSLPPPTIEPAQTGLRRVELHGPGTRSHFEVAYRAPAVTDPDYAAFLLVQQVLAGGRGVNFGQNEFGEPVLPGSRLADITEDLATWYPPQAAPYVFTVGGSIDPEASTSELEARLAEAVGSLLERPPTDRELAAARQRLLDELVFDVETTEDAAHQLAYFAGLDALDELLALPNRLAEVSQADVVRVAGRYLRPHQRTIGWYLAGAVLEPVPVPLEASLASETAVTAESETIPPVPARPSSAVSSAPRIVRLSGGLPVIFQRSPLSPAAYLRIIVPTTGLEFAAADAAPDSPLWGCTSLDFRFRPSALETALRQAREALLSATPAPAIASAEVEDPAERLAMAFDEVLAIDDEPVSTGASAIALVGDLQLTDALPMLEAAFGDQSPAVAQRSAPTVASGREVRINLAVAKAQAQLGYVVVAPPVGHPDWAAWRALLYVVSHGYEGRLGKEAITRRGLAYYIDSQYLTDGTSGRVSLAIGVDPAKLEAMHGLLRDTLRQLGESPPDAAELAEAKAHLLGRRISGAQSNEEISAALVEEWAGWGRLLSDEEFAAAVSSVSLQDVRRILPAFLAGTTVVVGVAE